MTVSGLLNIFYELPAFGQLVAELDEKKSVPPLTLPTSARTAVLAQLYLQRKVPIVLITGKVESAAAWIPESPHCHMTFRSTTFRRLP